jgi:hypothetical protein
MPDDVYWHDTLEWSERQSGLLRRLAAGERVNDVDWEHVIEEIEDVGKAELRACVSLLRRAIEHLMKLHLSPNDDAVRHWRGEVLAFLADARLAASPAMRQKIDLGAIYTASLGIVIEANGRAGMVKLPDECPFLLDELLAAQPNLDALLAKFGTSQA